MPSVSSIKDDLKNNKKDIAIGVVAGLATLFGIVKFTKWTKKELEE